MDHGAAQHPAAQDMAVGRTSHPLGAEGARRQRLEQSWHLLRTRPPRLQPDPWQWPRETGVLENGQGLCVSISSTDGAASLCGRVGTSFPCCTLAFPDGSAHGNMRGQAEHMVPVLAAQLLLLGARRGTGALLPAALASELAAEL